MNDFQSVASGQGILKQNYDSPTTAALRRRLGKNSDKLEAIADQQPEQEETP